MAVVGMPNMKTLNGLPLGAAYVSLSLLLSLDAFRSTRQLCPPVIMWRSCRMWRCGSGRLRLRGGTGGPSLSGASSGSGSGTDTPCRCHRRDDLYEAFDHETTQNTTNNFGSVTADTIKPFRESNDAFDDPEELNRRLKEEGYLFFRKLHDPAKVVQLRREITAVLAKGGPVFGRNFLKPGTDPMDGIADLSHRCTEGDVEYTDTYNEVYKLPAFHRAGHWTETTDMVGKLCGGNVLPHPQKICRIWFPKYTAHTTPMHQDYIFFQGSVQTYTMWSPVGECPLELGPLAVLPGSHKLGRVREHHFSLGAGGLALVEDELKQELGEENFGWVSGDFKLGDAIIFNAHMVHQALPNLTEDRMRISLDNRSQDISMPIAEHMLAPHLGGIDWESVYEEWGEKDRDLMYYWDDLPIYTQPTITKWGDRGFEEALEQAAAGSPQAIFRLSRVVRTAPDDPQSIRAAAVLEQVAASAASDQQAKL